MSRATRAVVLSVALAIFTAIAAAPASATTFCVPGFHAGCLDNGSNVAEADLEAAMNTNDTDGIGDRVLVGAITYTGPDSLRPLGTDPLTVIGSGTGQTRITSSSTSNSFVVNLSQRPTQMRDLTIVIPASFPDFPSSGSALQATNSSFDRVNVESLNDRSSAAVSMLGDITFRDCRFYGAEGGTINVGARANDALGPGTLRLVRTEIDDAVTGVVANTPDIEVRLEQSKVSEPENFAARAGTGGRLSIENSVIEAGSSHAIEVVTSSLPAEQTSRVSVASSTIVAKANATNAPLSVTIGGGPNSADAEVTVADSIIRGFDNTWDVDAPAGPGLGTASLVLTGSNFPAIGLPVDSLSVDFSDSRNIDQDPLFFGPSDYRLRPGSPSIDAAANAADRPRLDFDGSRRPLDGNGDGVAIRDQGAFERPDRTAPKITLLKSKKLSKGAIRISLRLSEPARLVYSLKPVPKRLRGKLRRTVVVKRSGRRGANALPVKGRRLSPGRYVLRVTAIDASDNRSVAVARARSAASFVPR